MLKSSVTSMTPRRARGLEPVEPALCETFLAFAARTQRIIPAHNKEECMGNVVRRSPFTIEFMRATCP